MEGIRLNQSRWLVMEQFAHLQMVTYHSNNQASLSRQALYHFMMLALTTSLTTSNNTVKPLLFRCSSMLFFMFAYKFYFSTGAAKTQTYQQEAKTRT